MQYPVSDSASHYSRPRRRKRRWSRTRITGFLIFGIWTALFIETRHLPGQNEYIELERPVFAGDFRGAAAVSPYAASADNLGVLRPGCTRILEPPPLGYNLFATPTLPLLALPVTVGMPGDFDVDVPTIPACQGAAGAQGKPDADQTEARNVLPLSNGRLLLLQSGLMPAQIPEQPPPILFLIAGVFFLAGRVRRR